MTSLTVSPQAMQVCSWLPFPVQSAALSSVHSPQLWPRAGIGAVSVSPHSLQTRMLSPASVQLGSAVVSQSPQTWV